MKQSWVLPAAIFSVAFVVICFICLCLIVGLVFFRAADQPALQPFSPDATVELSSPASATPLVIRPTAAPTRKPDGTPTAPVEATPATPEALPQPVAPDAVLRLLEESIVPVNDPVDLARRLEGLTGIPPTVEPPASPYRVGAQKPFWVLNSDSQEYFQVEATLRYATQHAYFWIEDGVSYRQNELRDLAETFEDKIYPTNRAFFGSEWTPGIDGDPRIFILYAGGLGDNVAGGFVPNDSIHPLIDEYSNGHEMFAFNSDGVRLGQEYAYGVLAHEFQHMIHWYRDRNESTWMNEGFSDLAMFLNGYDIGGHDYLFVENPDQQLNDWPVDQYATSPYYGSAFLFLNYFLDRFGETATQALVAEAANDMESIDLVLAALDVTDPLTGQTITADDVFTDWTLATYLNDESVADGRFTYHDYPTAPQTSPTESIRSCDEAVLTRDVRQYGTDIIRLRCRGPVTLKFEGSTQAKLLPADPYSGVSAFWSNKGDESDMTLTQTFDFSGHSGPLTLEYWTWFDIEENWDYLYLEASLDGESWELLTTPSGTSDDPIGANYGWGYTGLSGSGPEWIRESVDLSKFAGEVVQLRFEYITDAAVNGEGLLLDDIAIPEIGYFSDFEAEDGGWQAAGFVRVQNVLPQSYRLSLIKIGAGTTVEYIPLSADNSALISLDFGGSLNEVLLVVSGTTRFTRQPAAYRFSFSR